jgi:O-antigen ligase
LLEQSTLKTSRIESFLGLFFALSGALIATSLINVGDSGVPFYFITVAVPFVAIVLPGSKVLHPNVTRCKMQMLFYITVTLFLALLSTYCRLLFNLQPGSSEIFHLISRVGVLGYFGVSLYFLTGHVFKACLIWLRRLLIFISIYGIYQLPAKLLGLPLFLDWLRNNKSYGMYDYDAAGWARFVRATSIYAEPAQAAVPILVLILLNTNLKTTGYSKAIGWIAALSFTLFTFSRTAWLALATLILVAAIGRRSFIDKLFRTKKPYVAAAVISIALLMPLWAYFGIGANVDESRQERAGSVLIGIQLIKLHPIIGSGWNSYETLMPQYPIALNNINNDVEFKTIHNMFVGYMEQSGIPGLLLVVLPFSLILLKSKAPPELILSSVISFMIIAELGSDLGSLFWIWAAIVINWPSGALLADVSS